MAGHLPNQHSAARLALCQVRQRRPPPSYAGSVQSERDTTFQRAAESSRILSIDAAADQVYYYTRQLDASHQSRSYFTTTIKETNITLHFA